MVNDEHLLPRHAEISESFERAELEQAWRRVDPDNPDPRSLTGADLAAYQSWESATKATWADADRRLATEYNRLTALGLGPRPSATQADPVFPKNTTKAGWAQATLMVDLGKLTRDGNNIPLDAKALPEAWSAVRRNSRDLPGVLGTMLSAVKRSLSGPAASAYANSRVARQFEGYITDAMNKLTVWTNLIASSEDPGLEAMTQAAAEAGNTLSYIRGVIDPIMSDIERATGMTADKLPALMTDGVIMYVAAVAKELGNQYAARLAEPSFGLMFERISEIPARGAVPGPASPDYPGSAAAAQRSQPAKALNDVNKRLLSMNGLKLTDYQVAALDDAVTVTDFKSLGTSWDAWSNQLGRVPQQDMGALKASVSTLAYRLERLRKAVADGFIQNAELQAYALAPIDGLIALMQAQAEQAKALLQ